MKQSPWFFAFTHPVNLLMLAAAATAGLISAWWLFPLGLVFWFVMLLQVAFDPALRISQMIQDRNSLPQRFETAFNRIEKTQVSLYNALSSAKPQVKQAFEPLQSVVNDLIEHTYQLCVQMTPLENYQQVASNSNPENELNQLNRLMDAIEDPAAKKGYEVARQALAEKVNQEKATNERLSQMDALLIRISAEMDSLMADSARAQALNATNVEQRIPGLVNKVKELAMQLSAFEQQH
jgi:hypothetical protein